MNSPTVDGVTQVWVTGRHSSLAQFLSAFPSVSLTEVPVLDFRSCPVDKTILQSLRQSQKGWIIFSSPRAVEYFNRFEEGAAALQRLKVACVGRTTASAVEALGATVSYVPSSGVGTEAFLHGFPLAERGVAYLPAASGGREAIEKFLRESGWEVNRFSVYESQSHPQLPVLAQEIQRRIAPGDVILFTSPSSVEALLGVISVPKGVRLAAIGKFTESALAKRNLNAWICRGADWGEFGRWLLGSREKD